MVQLSHKRDSMLIFTCQSYNDLGQFSCPSFIFNCCYGTNSSIPSKKPCNIHRQSCVVSASASSPSENVFNASYPRGPGFFSVELCSGCTVFVSLALGSASPPALPLAAVSRGFLAIHNLVKITDSKKGEGQILGAFERPSCFTSVAPWPAACSSYFPLVSIAAGGDIRGRFRRKGSILHRLLSFHPPLLHFSSLLLREPVLLVV